MALHRESASGFNEGPSSWWNREDSVEGERMEGRKVGRVRLES